MDPLDGPVEGHLLRRLFGLATKTGEMGGPNLSAVSCDVLPW
jgi:hypothetical protein